MTGQPADRRGWLVVGTLVVLLVGLGLEDRRAHADEADRVEECVSATIAARTLADRKVSSMADYVRPALNGAFTPEVRTGLSRLVGGVARDSVAPLDAARSTCARIDVRPWHGDLKGRVDGCLETLDARLTWLDDVARDGTAAFTSAPASTAGCGAR